MDFINKLIFIVLSVYLVIIVILFILVPEEVNLPLFVHYVVIILVLIHFIYKARYFLSSNKVEINKRREILLFFLLYIFLLIGFASGYNSIFLSDKKAFKIEKSFEIQELDKELTKLNNSGELANAKMEYDKYHDALREAENEAYEFILLKPGDPLYQYIKRQMAETPGGVKEKDYPAFPKLIDEPIPIRSLDKDKYEFLKEKYTKDIDKGLIEKYISIVQAKKEKRRITYVDFLYFSAVTSTTVGYGDITPIAWFPRLIVILQILFNVFLVLIFVNLIVKE